MNNVDNVEIDKFSQMAHQWWDLNGVCKPLHDINPLRLQWIAQQISSHFFHEKSKNFSGTLNILDVGCGGGILSEGLALQLPELLKNQANITNITNITLPKVVILLPEE